MDTKLKQELDRSQARAVNLSLDVVKAALRSAGLKMIADVIGPSSEVSYACALKVFDALHALIENHFSRTAKAAQKRWFLARAVVVSTSNAFNNVSRLCPPSRRPVAETLDSLRDVATEARRLVKTTSGLEAIRALEVELHEMRTLITQLNDARATAEGRAAEDALVEGARRAMVAEINTEPGSREALEKQYGGRGKVWDTDELQEEFSVISFLAPFALVRRKSDGVEGTVKFQHQPRFYFDFTASGK